MNGQPDKSVTCRPGNIADLAGKHVAVVGGTGGLGRAIARSLATRGASVLVVGRTFQDQDVAGIDFLKADLSLMKEAQRVYTELPAEKLDLVVFTTGIMAAGTRQLTDEGIERDMAISYLSRLVILRGIANRLRAGTSVFVMGMPGTGQTGLYDDLNAEKSYKSMTVHTNTVAGNEVLVLDGAKRYPHLHIFGLNPGVVKTGIRNNYLGQGIMQGLVEFAIGLIMQSPETYAERMLPLLVSPDLKAHSGVMFNNKAQAIKQTPTITEEHARGFLEASDELLARTGVKVAS